MRRLLVTVVLALATRVASAGSLPSVPGMYVAKTAAPLPLVDSKLDVDVRGPIAEVTIAQTFENRDADATEATYIFPLPPDAAVTAMAIDVGPRTIHAAIEPRAAAQARYEDAIAKGLDAGLLEQERPDVFTQSVAAIPPHAKVTVHLRYDTAARFQDGTWQLVLPLVVAPRYVPGSANGRPTAGSGRSPDTNRAPDASRVTPASAPNAGGKTEIELAFESGVDGVTSPTHDLARHGDRYVIASATSDRDAVVRWHSKVPAQGWIESDGFAAVVVEGPPVPAKRPNARARLVFDRAATTLGDGQLIEHGLEDALADALDAGDLVATERGDFGSRDALRAELARAPAHHKFDLTKVLRRLQPAGAPIVLVTDGLVADDAAAIAAARALGVPIHVIGFGPAPNRSLLEAIAAVTGGTLRIAIVGDDLPAIAKAVLADVATQPAPFAVTWGTLAASRIVPANQPRLGAGQAAVVLARVAAAKSANARAAGSLIALASLGAAAPPAGATTAHGPIARMWARLELDRLVAAGDAKAVAAHALEFGLVSPETSMVAIGSEVTTAGGVRHTRSVPVSLPAGMRWQEVQRETTVDTERDEDQESRRDDRKTDDDSDKAKKPEPARHHAKAGADENKGEDEGEDNETASPAGAAAGTTEAAPESASVVDIFGPDSVEAMDMTGKVSAGRFARLAASLGGGLVLAHGDAVGMGALALRADYGRATRVGGEASLWLVDGLHAQGELGLYAGRLFERFEVDLGPELHLGDGIGPALELAVRYYAVHRLDIYLREDAGLLFDSGTHAAQSSTSAGLELSW
ncbi:MAG TPA: VIT domain-containing protein [Kofleriaceae bacterium]|jgi:Ca-activated chloride channel family protein